MSDTTIDEVADGIYRICTPMTGGPPGGFSFNRYLIVDEEPLLFHAGLRGMFAETRDAIARVMPPEKLRWIGMSHFEADECGAMNEFLAIAPQAAPLCGKLAAMISVGDYAVRPPRGLGDGETVTLGRHALKWFDTPHLPHGWDAGYLMDQTTRTFLCGDLFTQGGSKHPALVETDILEPSEQFRGKMDYYAHSKDARATLTRLAAEKPQTLACMHGSAWKGGGAALLMALAERLEA